MEIIVSLKERKLMLYRNSKKEKLLYELSFYKQEIKELSYYKKIVEQQRVNDKRCKEHHKHILEGTNHIVIDQLDITNVTAIYIYKLDCPAEQWMFDLGFSLQYESFATLIGKLEFGLIIENQAKIEKVCVAKEYRNQGIATYMMKKAIAWGEVQRFSELTLFASTAIEKIENELNQIELINFYHSLGFENNFPKSNNMVYKYLPIK